MTGLVAVEGSPPIRSALLSDLVALLNRNYWFLLSLNTLSPFPHQTLPSSSSEVFIYNLSIRTFFLFFSITYSPSFPATLFISGYFFSQFHDSCKSKVMYGRGKREGDLAFRLLQSSESPRTMEKCYTKSSLVFKTYYCAEIFMESCYPGTMTNELAGTDTFCEQELNLLGCKAFAFN